VVEESPPKVVLTEADVPPQPTQEAEKLPESRPPSAEIKPPILTEAEVEVEAKVEGESEVKAEPEAEIEAAESPKVEPEEPEIDETKQKYPVLLFMNKKEQIQEEVPYESEQKSVRCSDAVQLAEGLIKTSVGFSPSMAEISIMSWKALRAGSLQKFMYFSSSGLSCMTFFFGDVRVPHANTYEREPCD
jgi:hypothetical protein